MLYLSSYFFCAPNYIVWWNEDYWDLLFDTANDKRVKYVKRHIFHIGKTSNRKS